MKVTIPLFPLFLVFLILKLTGTVDWSWVWVTSPLWIGFAIILGILGFMLLLLIVGAILKML